MPSDSEDQNLENQKTWWERVYPLLGSSSGHFSDGYTNQVIGSVSTILKRLHPDVFQNNRAFRNISSFTFIGTFTGQFFFGYLADKVSRKKSMLVAAGLITLFTILSAGAYGKDGSVTGTLIALTIFRFCLGVALGGEHSAGAVAYAEANRQAKTGKKHWLFTCLTGAMTNCMKDLGFVVAAFVPFVLLYITSDHLGLVWRLALGLGSIPSLVIFFIRTQFAEPPQFEKHAAQKAKVPSRLVIKYYWRKLLAISMVWFVYDFSSYSFGIYSSVILDIIILDRTLFKAFGWNTVINLCYLPGAYAGASLAAAYTPRSVLIVCLALQSAVGFLMAGCYEYLSTRTHIIGFAMVYGLFLSLGEAGAGDNISTIASGSCATCIRGRYLGFASSIGKLGAFAGSWIFPLMITSGGGEYSNNGRRAPFWLTSAMCATAAIISYFALPHIADDHQEEDEAFRKFLDNNGFDTSQFGDKEDDE